MKKRGRVGEKRRERETERESERAEERVRESAYGICGSKGQRQVCSR